MFQTNQESLQLNGSRHLLVYVHDVIILGARKHVLRKTTQGLLVSGKETGL